MESVKPSNYTLIKIAEWIEKDTVSLPTVQRGFVWKPSQIENLWDSLLRGYPVGAFVLSPMRDNPDKFEMLDGQQRATAICLGFGKDTFRDSQDKIKIFIDLEKPKTDDNRKYILRVITRSHPWGYRRTDNTKTLTSDNIRKAMNLYNIEDHLEADLDQFYPYDAVLPVPFNIFLEASISKLSLGKLLLNIINRPQWKIIKKNWDDQIRKIEYENKQNPKSKKDLPYLATEKNIYTRIGEIYDVVNKMLHTEDGQKIPALYLDFEKYKNDAVRTLPPDMMQLNTTEEIEEDQKQQEEDAEDEIENLFIRLNSGGTPLRGEELNYSILKANIDPELLKQIEPACEGIFKPARFITIAYRLFQQKKEQEQRDALTMRIKPKQFQKTVSEKLPEFEKFIKNILNTKKYNGKTLLEYARYSLEYHEDYNTYGLPYLITYKIGDVAPEIMFLFLYRLMIQRDIFEFDTELHRRMIGMISLFMWLGKGENQRDHAKLLSNVWPCAKIFKMEIFWSSSTVQRALLNDILTPFPTYNGKYDKKSLVQIRKCKAKPNSDIKSDFNRLTKHGLFIDKMFNNRDLILYAQRVFLSKEFKEKQYHLDDTNVPFDWDHISPHKFIYKKFGIPMVIKKWYNSNGNMRAWPYSLNRMDQDDVPAIKFDPLFSEGDEIDIEIQDKWRSFIKKEKIESSDELKRQLLEWSFCSKEWATCEVREMKKGWKKVYELILERNLDICKEWYSELRIDQLISTKNEEFIPFIIDNRKWDLNPKHDDVLKKSFRVDGVNSWVSKPLPINGAIVYLYFIFHKDPVEVLEVNGIEFGIFEKQPGTFIKTIKIPDIHKMLYETDRKSYILGSFTLISHNEDSYVELFKNFKDWLERFPHLEIKNLANTFSDHLVVKYRNKI